MSDSKTHDQYDRYSILIQWSDEDDAYIVTVPELPGCTTHGATYEEALAHGLEAVESWIEANRAWGRPIPAPRTFAGV
jgi:predicted RNase H-like HicB family nuclease